MNSDPVRLNHELDVVYERVALLRRELAEERELNQRLRTVIALAGFSGPAIRQHLTPGLDAQIDDLVTYVNSDDATTAAEVQARADRITAALAEARAGDVTPTPAPAPGDVV